MQVETGKKIVIGVAVAVAGSVLIAATTYGSKVASTSPPWVSVEDEHHDLKAVRLDIKKGQIIAAWDRCMTAIRSPMRTDLVDEYMRQLAELQAEYQALTKDHFRYPLECKP